MMGWMLSLIMEKIAFMIRRMECVTVSGKRNNGENDNKNYNT
jgi:hypothetical protein